MLENRPNDALGTLVKLFICCKIFRIVQTVKNISHFEIYEAQTEFLDALASLRSILFTESLLLFRLLMFY